MPIDTKIEGSPESIAAAARWLTGSLADAVNSAANRLTDTARQASSSWEGSASDAFQERMTRSAAKTGDLGTAATRAASEIDRCATELARAQTYMRLIREASAQAGLAVTGDLIHEPGPAPAVPGQPWGTAATPQAVQAYNTGLRAAQDHAVKAQAYAEAQRDHDTARQVEKLARDAVQNAWTDLNNKWLITAADLAGAAAAELAREHISILKGHAAWLTDDAKSWKQRALAQKPLVDREMFYRDIDASRASANAADDVARRAAAAEKAWANAGLKLGGALTVVDAAYDVYHGKPVDQAVVSSGIGFGASVAAGAAIGTLIPVPILGTAVGAIGGAAVGLLASGMVDSLYQNGVGNVGQAFQDGIDEVGDTAEAIGGLARGAWHAIF